MTPRTVAHQAPLRMGFLRQENWSGLPFPSPGDLPKPGIKPVFPALAGGFFSTELAGKPKRSKRKYHAFQQDSQGWEKQKHFLQSQTPQITQRCRERGRCSYAVISSVHLPQRCPCLTGRLRADLSPRKGQSPWCVCRWG